MSSVRRTGPRDREKDLLKAGQAWSGFSAPRSGPGGLWSELAMRSGVYV